MSGSIKKKYNFFIAGIIQGSSKDTAVSCQNYRAVLKSMLIKYFPDSLVYCPVENHPNSVSYSDEAAHDVFFNHVQMASDSDCIIAYIPEASMGTAIEIWEAYHAGKIIIAISPMADNWVVRLLVKYRFNDIGSFEDWLKSGGLCCELERSSI